MKKMEKEKKKRKIILFDGGYQTDESNRPHRTENVPKSCIFCSCVCVCTGLPVLYATFTTHISRCTTSNYSKHPIRSGKKEKKNCLKKVQGKWWLY